MPTADRKWNMEGNVGASEDDITIIIQKMFLQKEWRELEECRNRSRQRVLFSSLNQSVGERERTKSIPFPTILSKPSRTEKQATLDELSEEEKRGRKHKNKVVITATRKEL